MSIKKNFLYNMLFTVFNLAAPLITMPYISRILGSNNLGIVSFSNSLVQYFMFLAALGTGLYGSREIAYVKSNNQELKKTFYEIFYIKLLMTLVSIIGYIFFIMIQVKDLRVFLILQGINLLGVLFDISWFFQGIEKFKLLSIRNIIVKFITIVLIFSFVKAQEDIKKYILILSIGNVISQLLMWRYLIRYLSDKRIKIKIKNMKRHFIKILKMFILQIAIQIYIYLDKVMLGYLTTNSEVAYYDLAQKIVRMPLAITGALGTVMLPAMSNLFAQKDYKQIKEKINNALIFSLVIAIPMCFGLVAISNNFIPWFLGIEYVEVIKLIVIISPIIIIIPIGNVIGIQLMIPLGKELLVSIAPIIGALLNVGLNFLLIPKYLSRGASIASVIAELTGTAITFYMMRHYFDILKIIKDIYKIFISSVILYFVVEYVGRNLDSTLTAILCQISLGMLTFVTLEILLKDRIVINIFKGIRRKK